MSLEHEFKIIVDGILRGQGDTWGEMECCAKP